MHLRQQFQLCFAFIRQREAECPSIVRRLPAQDQAACLQPLCKFDSGIVLDAKPVRETADGRIRPGTGADHQQGLILLRSQTLPDRCALAEFQKATQRIAEIRESLVIRVRKFPGSCRHPGLAMYRVTIHCKPRVARTKQGCALSCLP